MSNSSDLRPTLDSVRETLFNWLQQDIEGARCLDLFAGTGALGFESLSRGAVEAVMVESDYKLIGMLRQHATLLESRHHVIQFADSLSWLKQNTKVFDIVFLDPPFGRGYIEKCCALIREKRLLNEDGLVYIEAEKTLDLPEGWKIKKKNKRSHIQSMLISQE